MQTKHILKTHNLRPRKSLGQNFLIDNNIINKIITELDPKPTDNIIEIGSGLGALTYPIAESGAKLTAYEKDKKFSEILSKQFSNYKNVKIINQDFLKAGRLKADKVIGNLPYCITAPIIEKLIDNQKNINQAWLTIQKEVAERLVAQPDTKAYSSLTLYVNFYADVKKLFNMKPNSFYPAPKVTSSFIYLKFLKTPRIKVKDEELLFKIIRGAFGQRRKTITNSLSTTLKLPKPEVIAILNKLSISPTFRAENLTLQHFAEILDKMGK